MGRSGESDGRRVRGQMVCEWNGEKLRFHVVTEWHIVDARGNVLEILDRGDVARLEDDEWLERNLTRRARALAAETRAHTEEQRDGVQRLEF